MAIASPRWSALFLLTILLVVGAEVIKDASVASLTPAGIEKELEVSAEGSL